MIFYRRPLPHLWEVEQAVFLTWRLHDSLPPAISSGRAFAASDRLLDEARSGPFYLRLPAVAGMIIDAIQYSANTLGHHVLYAFAVMPNHVHVLVTPLIPLPKVTKSWKAITAKRANAMLALTGRPFRQEESCDRLVRNEREFESIQTYTERNPVRPGWSGMPVYTVARARDGRSWGAPADQA